MPGTLSATAAQIPVFDSIGAGKAAATSGTTFNWTQTIAGNLCLAFVIQYPTAANNETVKIGTNQFTLIGFADILNGGGMYAECWGLLSPPTGARTITYTSDQPLNSASGNSVSYFNAAGWGTLITKVGTANSSGALQSHSTSNKAGSLLVQSFLGDGNPVGPPVPPNPGYTNYNQTQRYNKIGTTTFLDQVIGEALGLPGSVAFSANEATSSSPFNWGSLILPINS